MAGLERITCTFHENDYLVVPPRTHADLPSHVLGTARWNSNWNRYYVPRVFTTANRPEPVEFLNNRWYLLHVDAAHPGVFFANASSLIAITNNLGLGYWDPSDPQHPDYQPTSAINADPPSPTQNPVPSSSSTTVHPTPIALPPAVVPTAPIPVPIPTVLPQATIPVAPTVPIPPTAMSTGTAPAAAPAPSGGLRGVPPTIFNGDRTKADTFWSEFRRYNLNNRTHPAMTSPFDRVLTALSYIRGPMVDDWVDAQETHLTTRTDTTQATFVPETDPILWTEFSNAFKDSWKDTSKKQNAHDQLRKLTMKGWDIDTYIVTFERLALAANWALPAEGTIMQFRQGLNKMIHSRALDRDKIPETFDEWKAAARTEVARSKEKYNMGLIGSGQRPQNQPRDYTVTQNQPRNTAPSNTQHVPMDVDATTTTTTFKKLTPEERTQLAKEGRCFRCRLQGHLARDCPKNTTPPVKAREASSPKETTPPVAPTAPAPTTPTPPTAQKLTRAQKIRALEAEMEEEERAQYMDDRDMGEDFWSAGA